MNPATVSPQRKDAPTSLRLRQVDVLALRYLARQDAHENLSATVRKIVAQRMKDELGRDWESVVQESSAA